MPLFYPPIDLETPLPADADVNYAERAVLEALDKGLDDKWHVFHRLEWRDVNRQGEKVGEADALLFHPGYGILVLEIKGGGVRSEKGEWFQTHLRSGKEYKLDKSPFQQARTSRFHFSDKLKRTALGDKFEESTAFTYTAWFPDITWTAPAPPDVPNGAFILDSRHLNNPSQHIRNILKQSNPHAKPWDENQTRILLSTLAPEFDLLVPLGVKIGLIRERIFRMTDGQLRAFKALKNQKRLLVEGCAGSGKTLIAAALAREHVQSGRQVLFTCYNRRLASILAKDFEGSGNIDVINYHELARKFCEETGTPFTVPAGKAEKAAFFRDTCPNLLLDCSGKSPRRYDTIIVDEAFDFLDTWWLSLEALGAEGFSYYAFYDRYQTIFTDPAAWKPPFEAPPIVLDTNVRNTRPIGRYAARLGRIPEAAEYGVNEGPEPVLVPYQTVDEIPVKLRALLGDLTGKQRVAADRIVVLSPYTLSHPHLGLEKFVKDQEKLITTDITGTGAGKVRIGTIQSFKGLEADVVVLCGIDGGEHACTPANLYVGATRARSMLYVIQKTT